MPVSRFYQRILENVPHLPDEAVVPVPVAALLTGTSERTVKDTFPLVPITERRQGVLLEFIRNRRKEAAAA
jgi:hypothetical protein